MAEWMSVAKVKDMQIGQGVQVPLDGKTLALFQLEDGYYAINDVCTHAGGSLAEGPVVDNIVTCPWHGATFDIHTGEALTMPAHEGVAVYKVRVNGDDIQVEV